MEQQSNSQAQLRHICNRLVSLENDKDEIAAEIKETRAKARSDGFDPGLISKTVKMLRLDAEKRKKAVDQLSLFDTYLSAVGVLSVLDGDGDEETPEQSGERRGKADLPPDPELIKAKNGDAEAHMRGWHRGNKAKLQEAGA
jgi:uncharacterized protein (UPF0335 family)